MRPKPSFPTNDREQTASMMATPYRASGPRCPAVVASRFRQGRKVLLQIEVVTAAMIRVGSLVDSPGARQTFLPSRTARIGNEQTLV